MPASFFSAERGAGNSERANLTGGMRGKKVVEEEMKAVGF
jgi:hypothetical protein